MASALDEHWWQSPATQTSWWEAGTLALTGEILDEERPKAASVCGDYASIQGVPERLNTKSDLKPDQVDDLGEKAPKWDAKPWYSGGADHVGIFSRGDRGWPLNPKGERLRLRLRDRLIVKRALTLKSFDLALPTTGPRGPVKGFSKLTKESLPIPLFQPRERSYNTTDTNSSHGVWCDDDLTVNVDDSSGDRILPVLKAARSSWKSTASMESSKLGKQSHHEAESSLITAKEKPIIAAKPNITAKPIITAHEKPIIAAKPNITAKPIITVNEEPLITASEEPLITANQEPLNTATAALQKSDESAGPSEQPKRGVSPAEAMRSTDQMARGEDLEAEGVTEPGDGQGDESEDAESDDVDDNNDGVERGPSPTINLSASPLTEHDKVNQWTSTPTKEDYENLPEDVDDHDLCFSPKVYGAVKDQGWLRGLRNKLVNYAEYLALPSDQTSSKGCQEHLRTSQNLFKGYEARAKQTIAATTHGDKLEVRQVLGGLKTTLVNRRDELRQLATLIDHQGHSKEDVEVVEEADEEISFKIPHGVKRKRNKPECSSSSSAQAEVTVVAAKGGGGDRQGKKPKEDEATLPHEGRAADAEPSGNGVQQNPGGAGDGNESDDNRPKASDKTTDRVAEESDEKEDSATDTEPEPTASGKGKGPLQPKKQPRKHRMRLSIGSGSGAFSIYSSVSVASQHAINMAKQDAKNHKEHAEDLARMLRKANTQSMDQERAILQYQGEADKMRDDKTTMTATMQTVHAANKGLRGIIDRKDQIHEETTQELLNQFDSEFVEVREKQKRATAEAKYEHEKLRVEALDEAITKVNRIEANYANREQANKAQYDKQLHEQKEAHQQQIQSKNDSALREKTKFNAFVAKKAAEHATEVNRLNELVDAATQKELSVQSSERAKSKQETETSPDIEEVISQKGLGGRTLPDPQSKRQLKKAAIEAKKQAAHIASQLAGPPSSRLNPNAQQFVSGQQQKQQQQAPQNAQQNNQAAIQKAADQYLGPTKEDLDEMAAFIAVHSGTTLRRGDNAQVPCSESEHSSSAPSLQGQNQRVQPQLHAEPTSTAPVTTQTSAQGVRHVPIQLTDQLDGQVDPQVGAPGQFRQPPPPLGTLTGANLTLQNMAHYRAQERTKDPTLITAGPVISQQSGTRKFTNVYGYPQQTGKTALSGPQGGITIVAAAPTVAASGPNPSANFGFSAAGQGDSDDSDWSPLSAPKDTPENRRAIRNYYRQLPGLWKVRTAGKPEMSTSKLLDAKAIVFEATVQGYERFRTNFIVNVHNTDIPIPTKAMYLRAILLRTGGAVAGTASRMSVDANGYKGAIEALERKFAGEVRESVFQACMLEHIREVKVGDSERLEEFIGTITDYLRQTEYQEGMQGEMKIFLQAKERLCEAYQLKFADWALAGRRRLSPLTLVEWAEVEEKSLLIAHEDKKVRKEQKKTATTTFPTKQKEPAKGDKPEAPKATKAFAAAADETSEQLREESGQDADSENELEDPVQQENAYSSYVPPAKPKPYSDGKKNYSKTASSPKRQFSSEEKKCELCKVDHLLRDCEKYKAKTVEERRSFLATNTRCYRCLRKGHVVGQCTSNLKCKHCDRNHHTTIHTERPPQPNRTLVTYEQRQVDPNCDTDDQEHEVVERAMVSRTLVSDEDRTEISLRILPVIITAESGQQRKVNALLDEANTTTMVSEKIAGRLNMKGYAAKLHLEGVHGNKTFIRTILAPFAVTSVDGKLHRKIKCKVLPNPTGSLRPVNWNEAKKNWEHLKDVDFPETLLDEPVDLLIGNDHPYFADCKQEIVPDGDFEPRARLTALGWSAIGPVTAKREAVDKLDNEKSSSRPTTSMKEIRATLAQNEDDLDQRLEKEDPDCAKTYLFHGDDSGLGTEVESEAEAVRPEPASDEEDTPRNTARDKELNTLVRMQHKLDRMPGDEKPDKLMMSREERYALHLLKEFGRHLADGSYEYPVLWKKGQPKLTNNRWGALKRFLRGEKSLAAKSQLARDTYHNVLKGWLEKGYLVEVEPTDGTEPGYYFLTHFPVVRQDKATTKVRPVLDGSAIFDGTSLNDAILPGPKLINDLVVVLLRFRRDYVAIAGDVSEMFLRIQLPEKDQAYHRILFRFDPEGPIREAQFTVHTFGNRGSPAVANYATQHHAELNIDKFPRAAEAVIKSTIVDDVMDSVESEELAIQTIADLKELYKGSKMVIRKFSSNAKAVIESVEPAERFINMELGRLSQEEVADMPIIKALGMVWIGSDDTFTYTFQPERIVGVWTMRDVARCHASLYDPLGLVAPFGIAAKMVSQECWRDKIAWDDPIPLSQRASWQQWIEDLAGLLDIRIPRCLKGSERGKVVRQELHTFADASGLAYAAVCYVVTEYSGGRRHAAIASAKARVCPLQQPSIPRLELMAAVLAVNLAEQTNQALGIKEMNQYYWSDSRNVLAWLATEQRALRMFVSNRVDKILTVTRVASWDWVPTDENPADVASRGATAEELKTHKLWFSGPEFLLKDRSEWPSIPEIETPEEAKAEFKTSADIKRDEPKRQRKELTVLMTRVFYSGPAGYSSADDRAGCHPEHFSEWFRFWRMLSMLKHWQARTRANAHKKRLRGQKLDYAKYYSEAEEMAVRLAQSEGLQRTLEELRKHGQVSPTNRYRKLQPALDKVGVIRLNARLKNAKHLSFPAKCPALLPKDHPITRLLVLHVHRVVLKHVGGPEHVLAELNQKYWIPHGRATVKKLLHGCVACGRINAVAIPQQMPPLPDFRFGPSGERLEAFSSIGIDYAGPFLTKAGRRVAPNKRYLALFTCLQYRAVHLEMATSLSGEDFLKALDRFVSRRGVPAMIVSDNGTNFVRGERDLRALWDNQEGQEKLDASLSHLYPKIKWWWNTPIAPHTGGAFERMVKAVKQALHRVLDDGVLTDEELNTAFIKVEALLNSRPITYNSTDPRDFEPLTPAHFLRGPGWSNLAPVPPELKHKSRWHAMQHLLDSFWQRFMKEYVPGLQSYKKWSTLKAAPEVGDVVMLLEDKTRGHWPLARITQLHRSEMDDIPRTVTVQRGDKFYKRSVHSLVHVEPPKSGEFPALPLAPLRK